MADINEQELKLKSELDKLNSDFKKECDTIAEKCTEDSKPNPMSFSAYSISCGQIWDEKYKDKFDDIHNRLDNIY